MWIWCMAAVRWAFLILVAGPPFFFLRLSNYQRPHLTPSLLLQLQCLIKGLSSTIVSMTPPAISVSYSSHVSHHFFYSRIFRNRFWVCLHPNFYSYKIFCSIRMILSKKAFSLDPTFWLWIKRLKSLEYNVFPRSDNFFLQILMVYLP